MLSIPNCQEGICELKESQTCCSLWNSFIGCSVLYSMLSWATYSRPPMLACLTQEDSHTLWINWWWNLSPPADHHLAVDSCQSKTKATLGSPWCWDQVSFFATPVFSPRLHYSPRFPGPLPWPISSEPFSMVGIVAIHWKRADKGGHPCEHLCTVETQSSLRRP